MQIDEYLELSFTQILLRNDEVKIGDFVLPAYRALAGIGRLEKGLYAEHFAAGVQGHVEGAWNVQAIDAFDPHGRELTSIHPHLAAGEYAAVQEFGRFERSFPVLRWRVIDVETCEIDRFCRCLVERRQFIEHRIVQPVR